MSRPSKLSQHQWEATAQRIIAGESISAIARELKMSKGGICKRMKLMLDPLKSVASEVSEVQAKVNVLAVSEQRLVMSMATRMRSMIDNVSAAADDKARVSAKMAALAKTLAGKIDEKKPDYEQIKSVHALLEVSNKADATPLAILQSRKPLVEPEPPQESDGSDVDLFVQQMKRVLTRNPRHLSGE
jgi:hypothetical protein